VSHNNQDFRYLRCKLPSEAFALHPEGPEPPPEDVVEEEVWRTIVTLPDDVSIRTSDNYGTELKAMTELWESVIDMCAETRDAWYHTVLDMAEGLQSCTFNALCGYYRVAASSLRAVLEVIITGTYLQLERTAQDAIQWQNGQLEIKFGFGCDHLSRNPRVRRLESHLEKEMQYSIFKQKRHALRLAGLGDCSVNSVIMHTRARLILKGHYGRGLMVLFLYHHHSFASMLFTWMSVHYYM
jgi:hypothetical protein